MFPKFIKKLIRKLVLISVPETELFFAKEYTNLLNNLKYSNNIQWSFLSENLNNNIIGKSVKIYPPSHISNSEIGDYSYIATNSYISDTKIGKFCSIGPNLICGWGIHPTTTLSTSPYFYSTRKQNGETLSKTDKIEERKPIKIGNDVFIGANVTILDGITIGDGAVIGAGAVVSKDIPPYSIAVGCPIKIIKKRFDDKIIEKLQKIQWWNFDEEKLKDVEKMFFNVNEFIEKYS